ncbi:DUF6314 family protein [Microbulbifer sp. S227A]|uniref:DUF6314 family protein n=1 Tax=Microbulbifer sp. S227A TaxID=3415131 RepID=UPI003C7CEC28
MPERARVLQYFAGRWSLRREIDHADGTRARFDGHATWSADGDRLRLEETGLLRIGDGPPFTATRRYFWHPPLSVHFDDGRFFHDVPPMGGDTGHWCAPDQYDGAYDFTPWPEFRVIWRVSGPRKSYRMNSVYRRIGG